MKPSADFLRDRRVAQRHVDKGLLPAEELKSFIDGLPDASANAAVTAIPIVKVSARKPATLKAAPAPLIEDNLYDLDDDDGDDD